MIIYIHISMKKEELGGTGIGVFVLINVIHPSISHGKAEEMD